LQQVKAQLPDDQTLEERRAIGRLWQQVQS
jgi:hypothetical protein